MYLKITEAARVKLDEYVNEGAVLILDMDDGVGAYSKVGFCSLDTSFRLLILDKSQNRKDYQMALDSDMGVVYIKDYSKMYLDEAMSLDIDPRLGMFKLLGPSGVLDPHVQLVDLRVKAQA